MTLVKKFYKEIIIILIILFAGIITFIVYPNIKENQNDKVKNQTDIIDEKNDIRIEGYLYKTKDGYGLMGWNLVGKIDFEPYVDKKVVVVGEEGKNAYELVSNEIIEMKDDSEIKTEEKVIYGVLKEDNIKSNIDRHYKIKDFDIRTNKDLSEYVSKEVAVLVSTAVADNSSIKQGDLIEIHIPYTIQGTLEVLSKESSYYHYKLGKYDIRSVMDITQYDKDYLKLLVFDGQYGSKGKNKVTLVKVQ